MQRFGRLLFLNLRKGLKTRPVVLLAPMTSGFTKTEQQSSFLHQICPTFLQATANKMDTTTKQETPKLALGDIQGTVMQRAKDPTEPDEKGCIDTQKQADLNEDGSTSKVKQDPTDKESCQDIEMQDNTQQNDPELETEGNTAEPRETCQEAESQGVDVSEDTSANKKLKSDENADNPSLKIKEVSPATKKLRNLGYDFDTEGILRQLDKKTDTLTNKKFEFEFSKTDKALNQKRYEELGEIANEYVYELLESRAGLQRVPLEKGSFIFVSEDWESNEEKLLILIHGSGVVRAGQWARRLIINDSLNDGTQLPYIERAKSQGYAIIVLNTNNNRVQKEGSIATVTIEGSESPDKHAISVWKQFVQKSPAKQVAIVAHSFGGVVTGNLAKHFLDDFKNRVFAVMFTDSVDRMQKGKSEVSKLFEKIALNYVTSGDPVGTKIPDRYEAVPMVSAGHETHEWTSASAFEHLFKRFGKGMMDEHLQEAYKRAGTAFRGQMQQNFVVLNEDREFERGTLVVQSGLGVKVMGTPLKRLRQGEDEEGGSRGVKATKK